MTTDKRTSQTTKTKKNCIKTATKEYRKNCINLRLSKTE